MVCRNICDRLGCKPIFEYDQYIVGKKYCRRCETYFYYNGMFCPCCGMHLRLSPTSKKGKERIRQMETHQRKKILNSVNLQIQPKLAKGVHKKDYEALGSVEGPLANAAGSSFQEGTQNGYK